MSSCNAYRGQRYQRYFLALTKIGDVAEVDDQCLVLMMVFVVGMVDLTAVALWLDTSTTNNIKIMI